MTGKYEILFFIITLLVILSVSVACLTYAVDVLQNSGLIEALAGHPTTNSGAQ